MFVHTVLFKIKESEKINFVADTLSSMEGKIPELKYLEVGINTVDAERNFDVILYTKFDSREDMDKYQVSEYHQEKVLKLIKPFIEKSVAGDYEI